MLQKLKDKWQKARIRWQQFSLRTRFTVSLMAALFTSVIACALVAEFFEVSQTIRGSGCYFFARAIQAQDRQLLNSGDTFLRAVSDDLASLGWEVWITDEQGKILSSSLGHPLPLDWKLIPKPTEEYQLVWGPRIDSPVPNLAILRLVSSPTRYMVFSVIYKKSGHLKIIAVFLSFLLWFVLLANFVFGRTIRREANPVLSESGFSLLEALIALTLMGIGLMAITSLLKINSQNLGHTNTKMAITSLSDTIRTSVDCEKTKTGNALVPATNCNSTSYKALELFDSRGERIGTNFIPQSNLNPLANSTQGTFKIGNWHVRAYCDNDSDSLIVRFARYIDTGVFYNDPLLKRPYDWQDSAENPLYGSIDRILCKGITGGSPTGPIPGSHIESAPMNTVTGPNRDCTPSFNKTAKMYLIAIGAPEYIALIPDSALVAATVQCPLGKIAVSGGATCASGFSVASIVASLGGSGNAPGYISESKPTTNGRGWYSSCCVEGFPSSDAKAYAICIPPPSTSP